MRKWWIGLTALVLLFALGPGVAFGQTAQFIGTVRDDSGSVTPGVTVTARNEQTGLTRTVVTDDTGGFRLAALPPGTYTVSVELAGFTTEERKGLRLIIDQTASLTFQLNVAAVAETVTVVGEGPVVDTTRSDVGTIIMAKQTDELPIATRRWVDFAMLTPGVSQDAIRGGPYRGSINVGSGLRFYSTMFLVDGVNNTWAQQGESRQNYGADAISEIKVSTSNFKAELGLATGGVLSVVTKSGTNDLRGNAFFFYRDDSLTEIEEFQSEKPPFTRRQYGGSVGGPIIRDKTHFFTQYERTDQDLYTTVSTRGIWPQYEGSFLSDQYFQTDTTRFDHQVSKNQSAFLRWSAERDKRPYSTVGGTVIPQSSNDRSKPSTSLVAGHTWILSDRTLNEIRFQRAYAKFIKTAPGSLLSSEGGDYDPADFGQVRLSQLSPVYVYPSVRVGLDDTEMGEEVRYQFKNDFVFSTSDWAGTHQWKAGFDYSHVDFEHDNTNGVLGTWNFPRDVPYDPNDRSTWPRQYSNSLPRYSHMPVHFWAVYIQDDWVPFSRLTLNLGLRYDRQIGSYGEDLEDNLARIAEKLGPEFGRFPIPVPFIDTSVRGDKNNFGPRVGAAWDITGRGTTSLQASYGLFYENFRTLQIEGELTWPQAQQIIIPNPSFPDPLQGQSREQFVSTAPPNINVMSNRLVSPYAHHYTVGFNHQLMRNTGFSIAATWVERYSDLDTIDQNLPDQVTRVKPYPQFARVSTTTASSDSSYKALYVKVDKRMSDHYQLLASYTLAKADDSPVTNRFGDRYGYHRVTSPSQADRRHRFVASGIIELPYNSQVSAILDYRSKLPFNPTTNLDLNADGYTGDLPAGVLPNSGCRNLNFEAVNAFRASRNLAAVSPGDVTCPSYLNFDIRFSKGFVFGGQRLEFLAQVLNVFNRAQLDKAISSLQSAAFGQTPGLIPFIVNAPSRQLEFALRFQF